MWCIFASQSIIYSGKVCNNYKIWLYQMTQIFDILRCKYLLRGNEDYWDFSYLSRNAFFFLQRKISLSCQDIKCCHILQTIFFLNKKRVLRPFWQHIAKKLRIGGYALYNRISEICNSCKCSCMASLSLCVCPMINNNRFTSTKICKCCKCFMLG